MDYFCNDETADVSDDIVWDRISRSYKHHMAYILVLNN